MLFYAIAAMHPAGSVAYAQGTVTLNNLSYPYTAIEVGNFVQVQITGAAPYGEVTLVQNGGSPYDFGMADGSGNWSITAQETAANVGDYEQVWYVNDVEVNPVNTYTYISNPPTLPDFSVYSTLSPSEPSALNQANACGGDTNVTATWIWTPVNIYVDPSFTFSSTDVSTSTANWEVQDKVVFQQSATVADIWLENNSSLPVTTFGGTALYTSACNANCYGYIDECTGACAGPSTLAGVIIQLNGSAINLAAGATQYSADTFAVDVLNHELGHSLALADVYPLHEGCSESGTVMTQAFAFLCGSDNPTSLDLARFNSIYPSGPNYCAASNYCDGNAC